MKVKGLNKFYEVEVKKMRFEGKDSIVITCRSSITSMISVMISEENWKKLKEIK